MYEELVKRLRKTQKLAEYAAEDVAKMPNMIFGEAADAIETMREMVATAHDELANVIQSYEESKPRWIPVTERLPEDGVYVLAYSADDDYMCVEARHKFAAFQVTHWMPLPAPPKEET